MLEFIQAATSLDMLPLPLYLDRYPAGFPSLDQDYVEAEFDLNEYCIQRRSLTYFVRVPGDSMTDIGL